MENFCAPVMSLPYPRHQQRFFRILKRRRSELNDAILDYIPFAHKASMELTRNDDEIVSIPN